MFFPSPSTWNMVKDTTNHVPMNMIGLAQISLEILEGGDVPIFTVVLSTPDYLQFNCDCTGILLSTFFVEGNTICIWLYVQWERATPPPHIHRYMNTIRISNVDSFDHFRVTTVKIVRTRFLMGPFLLMGQTLRRKDFVIKTSRHGRYEITSNVAVCIWSLTDILEIGRASCMSVN